MADPIDSLGFREAIFDLPEQVAAAVRSLTVTGPLPAHDDIANVRTKVQAATAKLGAVLRG